ncbi:MAG: hypothetical protein NE330_16065 [Lentisphaeraceae bacterium]|nr:hypothetical protein [Lentisphaeraceae bacterium]
MIKSTLIVLLSIYSLTAFAQNEQEKSDEQKVSEATTSNNLSEKELETLKKRAQEKQKNLKYVFDFIQKKYVATAEKELPKLESKIKKLQVSIQRAKTNSVKQKYTEKLKALEIEAKKLKLWKLYSQEYIKYHVARIDKKTTDSYYAMKNLSKLRKVYKKLTGQPFPDPEKEFYKTYGKKLAKSKTN